MPRIPSITYLDWSKAAAEHLATLMAMHLDERMAMHLEKLLVVQLEKLLAMHLEKLLVLHLEKLSVVHLEIMMETLLLARLEMMAYNLNWTTEMMVFTKDGIMDKCWGELKDGTKDEL